MLYSIDLISIKMVILKCICSRIESSLSFRILGKIFIKDFLEELEMQEIEVNATEIEKITKFADTEGQVSATTLILCETQLPNFCSGAYQSLVWFMADR